MSGKTTYLKQAPLLLIMASIGSLFVLTRLLISRQSLLILLYSVPAEFAAFPPVDRILTRLSNDDEPEANLSTFASEMKAAVFILSLATKHSLVIIDELGVSAKPLKPNFSLKDGWDSTVFFS